MEMYYKMNDKNFNFLNINTLCIQVHYVLFT